MVFELRKNIKVTAEGEKYYYCTYMDGAFVDGTVSCDEDEGKTLYMLAVENRGQMQREEVLHSMEVSDASD